MGGGGCTAKTKVSKHDRVDDIKSVVETRKSEMQTSDRFGKGGECYRLTAEKPKAYHKLVVLETRRDSRPTCTAWHIQYCVIF